MELRLAELVVKDSYNSIRMYCSLQYACPFIKISKNKKKNLYFAW